MTLSEIRRAVNALKRKFARELAIIKARRVAEAVADHWDRSEPPEPSRVIRRFVDAGLRSNTWVNLTEYLNDSRRKEEIPYPDVMVRTIFPWAWDHRYDGFFDWDLPPEPAPRPAIPEWMR